MINITFETVITSIVILSVVSVCIAVVVDFIYFNNKDDIKSQKRSVVATGTMTIFVLCYYLLVKGNCERIILNNESLRASIIVLGTIFMALGAIINIWGRFQLKSNWANHIKIYKDHSLITTGVYSIVRHPLYASIMLMLFGGSMVYMNYVSAIFTAIVFIPIMYFRAKQEETMLEREFSNYNDYKRKVGMFFPKIWRF